MSDDQVLLTIVLAPLEGGSTEEVTFTIEANDWLLIREYAEKQGISVELAVEHCLNSGARQMEEDGVLYGLSLTTRVATATAEALGGAGHRVLH